MDLLIKIVFVWASLWSCSFCQNNDIALIVSPTNCVDPVVMEGKKTTGKRGEKEINTNWRSNKWSRWEQMERRWQHFLRPFAPESGSETSFPILLQDESDRCRGNPFCHIHDPVFDSWSDFGISLFRLQVRRSLSGSKDQVRLNGLQRRGRYHRLREYNVQWHVDHWLFRLPDISQQLPHWGRKRILRHLVHPLWELLREQRHQRCRTCRVWAASMWSREEMRKCLIWLLTSLEPHSCLFKDSEKKVCASAKKSKKSKAAKKSKAKKQKKDE